MEQQTVRKTYKYKLKPTPEQERELGRVLGLCRWLYNTALGAAHHRLATSARLRLALSAGSRIEGHPRGVPRVRGHPLAMSCKMCWRGSTRPIRRSFAGCRRERRRASRAIRARDRYHSFTYKEYRQRGDAGQRLPGPVQDWAHRRALVVARWRARPRRSRSAGKRMAGMSASPAPMCRYSRLPPTGQETGIDLGH